MMMKIDDHNDRSAITRAGAISAVVGAIAGALATLFLGLVLDVFDAAVDDVGANRIAEELVSDPARLRLISDQVAEQVTAVDDVAANRIAEELVSDPARLRLISDQVADQVTAVDDVAANRIAEALMTDAALRRSMAQSVAEELPSSDSVIQIIDQPDGLIAAFNRPCPNGWRDYQQADGRFLTGDSANLMLGSEGGEAAHTLTVAELPNYELSVDIGSNSHAHGLSVQFSRADGTTGSDNPRSGADSNSRYTTSVDETFAVTDANHSHAASVRSDGGGQAQNNLPPFHVVEFCTPDDQ